MALDFVKMLSGSSPSTPNNGGIDFVKMLGDVSPQETQQKPYQAPQEIITEPLQQTGGTGLFGKATDYLYSKVQKPVDVIKRSLESIQEPLVEPSGMDNDLLNRLSQKPTGETISEANFTFAQKTDAFIDNLVKSKPLDLPNKQAQMEIFGHTNPTKGEILVSLALTPVAIGAIQAPLATAGALAVFKTLSEVESAIINKIQGTKYKFGEEKNLTSFLPEDTSEGARTLVTIIDILAKGGLMKKAYDKAPAITDKFTKDIITEYKLPEQVYIPAKKVKSLFQTGKDISKSETEMLTALGMDKKQWISAIKDGVDIAVPAKKIVTIADKPYWAKIKKVLKIEPTRPVITTQNIGEATQAPKGLLETPKIDFVKELEAQTGKPFKPTKAPVSKAKVETVKEPTPAIKTPTIAKEQGIEPLSMEVEAMNKIKQKEIDLINKSTVEGSSQKSARLKAVGMEYSAKQRKLTGDITPKELGTALKYLNSNFVGKEVEVLSLGKKGKVVGTSFGKIRVKIGDEIKSIEMSDIRKVNVTNQQAKDYLKEQTIKELDNGVFGKEYKQAIKEYKPPIKTPQKPVEQQISPLVAEAKKTVEPKKVEPPKVSEKRFSLHYEKLKEQFGFSGEGIEIGVKTNKEGLKKAYAYLQRNPEKGMRVSYGLEAPPKEIMLSHIQQSAIVSLREAGKDLQAEEIAKKLSVGFTEAARTLQSATNDLSPSMKIIKNITTQRLEKIGSGLGEIDPTKMVARAEKHIKAKAKTQTKKVVEKEIGTLEQVDKLIDSLLC